MAAECSHQDQSRKGVSSTAHGVASLRGLEAKLAPELQLFNDPYADLLGGEVGMAFINSFGTPERPTPYGLIDSVAVRTKKFDDEVKSSPLEQICIFGAGLDTRAWRLKKTVEHSVNFFEVDFPEIFDFKLNALKSAGASSEFIYHSVNCDLSLSGWPNDLLAAGFDATKPTLFLMEGLISYLTEDEANAFFRTIGASLAARGSRLIMTCLTPAVKIVTSMHRFFPESPLAFVTSHGWEGEQEEIEAMAARFGRPLKDKTMKGYYIVTADLK